jgi:serine/threonine-protein kinase
MRWDRTDLIWGTRRWEVTGIAVPDVVDETEGDAGTAIVDAGLVVDDTTSDIDPAIVEGNVISQFPVADKVVGPGSGIDLVISLGIGTAVPDVVDETEGDATTAIEGEGLVVGDTTEANDPAIILGNVISQDPVATTRVIPGSAVDLVISLGPA